MTCERTKAHRVIFCAARPEPLALVDGQARPRGRRTMPEHIAVADERRRKHYTAEALALVDGLLVSVAARHGVTLLAARSRRIPAAVAARHEWLRLLRDTLALPVSEVARLTGVDYASVQYALGWRRGAR